MQLEELIGGVEKEELLIIKDYLAVTKKKKTPETVMEELSEIPYEELTKQVTVAKLLGYENFDFVYLLQFSLPFLLFVLLLLHFLMLQYH